MAVESADSHDAQADEQAGGNGGSSGGRGSQPQPGVGGSLPARHPDSMLLGACWQRARKAAEAQPPRMPGMCTCRKAATGTRSGFAIHTLGLRWVGEESSGRRATNPHMHVLHVGMLIACRLDVNQLQRLCCGSDGCVLEASNNAKAILLRMESQLDRQLAPLTSSGVPC